MFTARITYAHIPRSFRALKQELPGVAARMLTEFARAGQSTVQAAIPQRFDRPTPFTVRRVLFQAASRTDLVAATYIPDSVEAGGKSTSEYMRPGAVGSAKRAQKKTEFLLSQRGILPAGWVLAPGSYMQDKKDAYGNVPGSYYKQVIRALQIRQSGDRFFKGVSKASRARAARMGVAEEFFAVGQGRNASGNTSHLRPGIYRVAGRRGDRLDQYFVFKPRAAYRQRLDIEAEVMRTVQAKAPAIWQSVMRDVCDRVIEKRGRSGA